LQEGQSSAAPAAAAATGQKRRPDTAARHREQQVLKKTTVIKTGFNEYCVDKDMACLLEGKALPYFSQTTIEAALFRNLHVLRCCEQGIPLEKLDLTFFGQSLIAIGPNGLDHKRCKASPALKESLQLYKAQRPAEFVPLPEKEHYMKLMLEEEAKLDHINFKSWMNAHFTSYLCRWIRMCIDDHFAISGFQIGRAKYVRSAVSLVLTAATNEDGDVDALLPRYKLLHTDLDNEEVILMKILVARAREIFFQNFSTEAQPLLPLHLSEDTYHLYMPCLHRILVDLEARVEQIQMDMARGVSSSNERHRRGTRVFSMLPQKSVQAHHMHVSNTIQRALIEELATEAEFRGDELLHAYYTNIINNAKSDQALLFHGFYNFSTVIKHHGEPSARKEFMSSFKTDCIAVSVTVGVLRSEEEVAAIDAKAKENKEYKRQCAEAKAHAQPRPKKPPDKSNEEQKSMREEQIQRAIDVRERARAAGKDVREIGIDPGLNNVVTVAVHSDAADAALGDATSNVKYETFSVDSKQYQHWRGLPQRKKQMDDWMARDGINEINAELPTAKTASMEKYCLRITAVLNALPKLLNFHVTKRRVRRLRFGTYLRTQRAVAKVCNMITGGNKYTIVGFGDGCKNPHIRGTQPVFSNRIARYLATVATLCWVDEFRTSAVCCRCCRPVKMQGLRVPSKNVDGEVKYKRLYGVRCCETSTCYPRNLWNRDNNSAISIVRRLRRDLAGEEHPRVYCRVDKIPLEVLQVDDHAEEEERESFEGL
jgi:hypothetical protein